MTYPVELTITVHTPLLSAVPDRAVAGEDLTTVLDSHGLPYLPRTVLSARLRDAALTVLLARPQDAETALQLWGAAGSTLGSRVLRVGAAVASTPVRRAVAAAVAARPGVARAVALAATTPITTTAIGADGAPAQHTLRQVRAAAPPLVLHAPLSWMQAPTDTQVAVLARCCLALTQIGRGATRGAGRVSCTLDNDLPTTRTLATTDPADPADFADPADLDVGVPR